MFLENSQYVGEVGVRQEFTATIVDSFSFEGQWGYTTVTTLRDENNNCIKYWNSINSNDYITEGDVVTFKATVKQHMVSNRDDETYGQQQTVISRASKAKLVKEGK